MNRQGMTPIALTPLISRDGQRAEFLTPERRVEINVPQIGLLHDLLEKCDGTRSVDYIVEELESVWGREDVLQLIVELHDASVLIDSQSIWPLFREFACNPAPWGRKLSPEAIRTLVEREFRHPCAQGAPPLSEITELEIAGDGLYALLRRRSSVREFRVGTISEIALARLCWAAYGFGPGGRTVPSAGALYPLTIHLVLLRGCGRIERGTYAVLYAREGPVELHRVPPADDINADQIFIDATPCVSAVGYFIISADVDVATAKYATRGITYTLLEAGHVAQNIHLSCLEEMNLGSVELGGFFEDAAAKLLGLREDLSPLVSVVFGVAGSEARDRAPHKKHADALTKGSTLALSNDIEYSASCANGYELPFYMCFARSTRDATWSCGRSRDPEVAKAKALSENFERDVADGHCLHDWVEGTFTSLNDSAIDPRHIHPYVPEQFAYETGISAFAEDAVSTWVPVQSLRSGEQALLLADLAVFPYCPSRRYAYANSSGIAAHSIRETAIENAAQELVERDAFMITWANRLAPRPVRVRREEGGLYERIEALKALGLTVSIGDIGFDFGFVPLVSAVSRTPPFFTCAAAYRLDAMSALDHALMEVESKVFCWLRDGPVHQCLLPAEADSPDDHAAIYQNARWIEEAAFLLELEGHAKEIDEIAKRHGSAGESSLLTRLMDHGYEPFVLDLGKSPVGVYAVRVVIPGLVPMAFGYGLDALGAGRLLSVPSRHGRVGAESVDTLNRMLHPYD